MAIWNEKFGRQEDERREKGLNNALEKQEQELDKAESMEEKRMILLRIVHIFNELETEAFEYDKQKYLHYQVELENMKSGIKKQKDQKREKGLQRALHRYTTEYQQTDPKDIYRQYILLNRIYHIYEEIKEEGFFFYKEEMEYYQKELKKVEEKKIKQEEMDREKKLMEMHQEKDPSWKEFQEEENDFER